MEHNNDDNVHAYTYKRRPVTLKYFQHFQDINQAIEFEKQIKGWSRKKKEAFLEKIGKKLKSWQNHILTRLRHPDNYRDRLTVKLFKVTQHLIFQILFK